MEQSRVMRLDARAFHDLAKSQPEFGAAVRALAQDRIGGLQGIAAEPFKAQATAVGDPLDDASLALRRFLERNHITYDWIAPDAPDRDTRWTGEPLAPADLPAILCTDGTTLKRPAIRLIADKLGLQTSPRARPLRHRHHRRRPGRTGGRRLRRVRGPAHRGDRTRGARRPGRHLVADRELPRLSERHLRRRTRRPRATGRPAASAPRS